MDKHQRDVRAFHLACGLPAPERPTWRGYTDVRVTLIEEELQELKDAISEKDLIGVIDALCDLDYVVQGCAVAFGIDLEPFWEIVQNSNLRKVSGPKREDGKQLKPEGWKDPTHEQAKTFRQIYGRWAKEVE